MPLIPDYSGLHLVSCEHCPNAPSSDFILIRAEDIINLIEAHQRLTGLRCWNVKCHFSVSGSICGLRNVVLDHQGVCPYFKDVDKSESVWRQDYPAFTSTQKESAHQDQPGPMGTEQDQSGIREARADHAQTAGSLDGCTIPTRRTDNATETDCQSPSEKSSV